MISLNETDDGRRPLIMVSNDDGVDAPGIKALAQVALRYADVIVVAPDGPNSGKSHSFTVMDELRVRKVTGFSPASCFAVKGTPVDCIKVGFFGLADRRPSLILSGINHGSNTSISVHYSGTLGAAREAAMLRIPAIGFSFANSDEAADLAEPCRVADALIGAFFNGELPKADYLSVNIPRGKVSGIRFGRLAMGRWIEKPTHYQNIFGLDLYWLNGSFENDDLNCGDTDEGIISSGWASVTPLRLDVTDYDALAEAENFKINF